MQSFSNYFLNKSASVEKELQILSEAVSLANIDTVGKLIISYFGRKLGTAMTRMPGGDEYFNETGSGLGVLFFFHSPVKGFDAIRFNWVKKSINSAAVDSIDLFKKGKNVYNIAFDKNTSLVKVLPFMLNFINSPKKGYVTYVSGEELNEATGPNPLLDINEYLVKNNITEPLTRGGLHSLIKKNIPSAKPSISGKLFDTLKNVEPRMIVGSGRREAMDIGGGKLGDIAERLFDAMFTTAKVTSGSKKESYVASSQAEELEKKGLERLAFEQQLEDMREAVRMLYRGITNAVFIGGRGGIGKTFNVEKVLEELGLSDGNGYFKNAGSISAAGLYRTLFRNRTNLMLFDDSDSVFGDQEARNILKGATDTKKVRKIAWSKKSSDIIPGDEFSDDMEDEGLFPSFFEYTGKIIFISNLKMDKLDPDGALRTRGIMMEIDPTDEEVYNLMAKIVGSFEIAEGLSLTMDERLEVVDLLRNTPSKAVNFRVLDRALNMRAGATAGFDWKKFVIYHA